MREIVDIQTDGIEWTPAFGCHPRDDLHLFQSRSIILGDDAPRRYLGELAMTMTKEVMDCIDACTGCMQLCLECADDCKQMGGMDECVRLCRICHDECDRHAKAIHTGDHGHAAACTEACDNCAAECEKGARHMDVCRRCAEACRECAEACRTAEKSNVR